MFDIRRSFLLLATLLLSACVVPRPDVDRDAPTITVTVAGARGDAVIRSTDSRDDPTDLCIKVDQSPVELSVIFGDAGGIQSATMIFLAASIDRDSVTVTPAAPEASASVDSVRGGINNQLRIRLSPPEPGTVRTGATARFKINTRFPTGLTAEAIDYAGNVGTLTQLEIRSTSDAVICRGN